MAVVSMKQLLEAGVHFGHQTRRWNPKMKPFIYTERNGIHIIDLQKTVNALEQAYNFVQDTTRQGGRVLFVGTKKQAQEAIAEEAARANQYFVNQRWLGGLLTNFQTIQQRLRRLDELEQMRDTGMLDRLPKKEQLKINDEIAKLTRLLGGIRGMRRLPNALFIIDTRKEHIAIHEAERLGIPVVALVDTNANPDEVAYPIPANDDAIRAVRLLSAKIAEAAHQGAEEHLSTLAKEEAEEGFEPTAYEGYTFEPEGYDAALDAEEKAAAAAAAELTDGEAASEPLVNDLEPETIASPEIEAAAPAEAGLEPKTGQDLNGNTEEPALGAEPLTEVQPDEALETATAALETPAVPAPVEAAAVVAEAEADPARQSEAATE